MLLIVITRKGDLHRFFCGVCGYAPHGLLCIDRSLFDIRLLAATGQGSLQGPYEIANELVALFFPEYCDR